MDSAFVNNLVIGVAVVVGILVLVWLVITLIGIRVIGSNQVGVVEKWWSTSGSLKDKIIALEGEAGYQPDVLRAGIHLLSPLLYRVHRYPLVTIPQGQIGYIFARDGRALRPDQTLAEVVDCANFQDTRAFLAASGQKGPQRAILREGTYAFNLAQFIVLTEQGAFYHQLRDPSETQTINAMVEHLRQVAGFTPIVIRDKDDLCGIVTVHDGPSLPTGDIIAPTVGDLADQPNFHNNFQDPEKFLAAGGYRGRQLQVLTEGTYFINRFFATVEPIAKTIVGVGWAGVVISYVGPKGEDLSGDTYSHGELVANGNRGVWKDPLMPGKYAFNTYAGAVVQVPTTNIILKWISGEAGAHHFDENLAEIGLITKDAFEPYLPLSVVIHIDYRKAPLVIQRFGDVKLLVNQTLDPMVGAYFKNIGQQKTLIELIQSRSEIQDHSSQDMKVKFQNYNLELEEVLIGTPRGLPDDTRIENILTQLRDRQVAREQLLTFDAQREAADKQRELKQSEATAVQQTALTESNINISIQENLGRADAARAVQDGEKIRTLARANADQIKFLAEADSVREAQVGIGKAIAVDQNVQAYGGPGFVLTQSVMERFSAAVENGQIPIVPRTVVEMGGGNGDGPIGGGGSNAFGLLMTLLATEKLTGEPTAETIHDDSVEALRKQILEAAAAGVRPVVPVPPADIAPPVPADDTEAPGAEPDKPSQ
jgi:uncharacterized membrane protein YqiK